MNSHLQSYQQELQSFKQQYPDICFLDLIYPDVNATPRGKRIPIEAADKLASGIYLSVSTISLSVRGNVVEEAGLGEKLGEPDLLCLPVPNTLKPTFNPRVGQVMLTMTDSETIHPSQLEPRQVLSGLLEQLHARQQYPVVALELEFHLIDQHRDADNRLQFPMNPARNQRDENCEVYNVENLDDYADFLTDLSEAAKQQGLNTSGALAESAPGQFEINFYHQQDVLNACDQVIFAKRLIRQVARKYHFDVTFMAKPFAHEAGNGKHIHLSVVDEQGQNLFSDAQGQPSALFHKTLSSMLATMPESMALLCPNVNSYRRFTRGTFTPTLADWGENHRGVALRIPVSDSANRRIEHRVAGADVNPYLLCAVIAASLLHANALTDEHCPEPLSSNAVPLPRRMSEALSKLETSEVLTAMLGKAFIELYLACKRSDLEEFERFVTPLEIDWMLHSA